MDVNFSCQRCCQPLNLHSTLNNITKETIEDLLTKNKTNCSFSEDNKSITEKFDTNFYGQSSSNDFKSNNSGVIHKNIDSFRNMKLSDCDYSVINTDVGSQLPSTSITSSLLAGFEATSNLYDKNSKDLNVQIQLFDILSDQSDIDHPLCEECADFVIEQMDKQLMILEQDCLEYNEFKNKIQQLQSTVTDEEIESLKVKLKDLNKTQSSLIKEIKTLNKQHEELNRELQRSEKDLKQAELEEEKYWKEYNAVKFQYHQCEIEHSSLIHKRDCAKKYYDKLKATSIFNLAFSIWHKGGFGIINGYRLGRTPNVKVGWQEINTAWGQCALLLHSLTNKIGFTFLRYKIVPYGNHSFIEILEDKSKQLPLFSNGGIKFYFNQKFDQAMVAFLDCFQQFYKEIQNQDKNFKLPYEMNKKGEIFDKANNMRYTVKMNINTEEKWTKALKLMLTNLKWAIAWVDNNNC